MYCHVTGIVFWLLFPFNSSKDLHKIIQKCSCFLSLSHNWSRESNTILVNLSLHRNTFNQFQIPFKTRFTTKTRNAEMICHLFSQRRHSCYRRVQNSFLSQPTFSLWFWVDCWSSNTNKCSFLKLDNRWRCNRYITSM